MSNDGSRYGRSARGYRGAREPGNCPAAAHEPAATCTSPMTAPSDAPDAPVAGLYGVAGPVPGGRDRPITWLAAARWPPATLELLQEALGPVYGPQPPAGSPRSGARSATGAPEP